MKKCKEVLFWTDALTIYKCAGRKDKGATPNYDKVLEEYPEYDWKLDTVRRYHVVGRVIAALLEDALNPEEMRERIGNGFLWCF